MNLSSTTSSRELLELEELARYLDREVTRLRKHRSDDDQSLLPGLEAIRSLLASGLQAARRRRERARKQVPVGAAQADFTVDYCAEEDCLRSEGVIFSWKLSAKDGLTLTSL